jgi:dTDP-4-dehydrorhamnose 3,5-epimerase
MKVTPIGIQGLLLVELKVYGDARGFFVERYHQQRFAEAGFPGQFVQDNHSRSAPGVLRGLHYQLNPSQGKLVGAIRGEIWDAAVDIRPNSPTFGKHFGVELTDVNGKLLWIPPGFAHGFCVLGTEPADVLYKVDATYNPSGEGGIMWNDPEIALPWPIKNPTISARDQGLATFAQYKARPPVWDR